MLRSQSHIFLQPKVPNSIKSFLRSEQNPHRRSQQDMSSSSRVSTPLSYGEFSSSISHYSWEHSPSRKCMDLQRRCCLASTLYCWRPAALFPFRYQRNRFWIFHCTAVLPLLRGRLFSASYSPTASLLSTPWVQPRHLLRRLSSLLRQRNNAMHSAREKRRTADPDNRKGIAVHCSSTQPYLNCQPQCPWLSANLPAIS